MATLNKPRCPVCPNGGHMHTHCENKGCKWWVCQACGSFGHSDRWVKKEKKP